MKAVRATRIFGRRTAWAVLPLVALGAAWVFRHEVLAGAGAVLVSEDAPQPVQVIMISAASTRAAGALEAAQLYRAGFGTEIVVAGLTREPLVPVVRALGVPLLGTAELIGAILERSDVPASAVRVLPGTVDGTDMETAAVAAFAQQRRPSSLLFITARNHTARARWLLRRELPATTRLLVRAPRTDRFRSDAWWHSREQSRDVLVEYLRWFNTLILRDPWNRTDKSEVGSENSTLRINQELSDRPCSRSDAQMVADRPSVQAGRPVVRTTSRRSLASTTPLS